MKAEKTTRQKLRTLLPILLLLGSSLSAGCFLDCGRPLTIKTWEQAGVYEAMPSPGRHAGFTIEHVDDHWGDLDHVARKKDPQGQTTVIAESTDRVYFDLSRRGGPLDNATTAQILNSTFKDLGLPQPSPGDWIFHWEDTIC